MLGDVAVGSSSPLIFVSFYFPIFNIIGIVKGVSRIIFHTDIAIEKVDFQMEEYIGIKKSHYTFLITFVATNLPEIGHDGAVKEEVSISAVRSKNAVSANI